MRAGQSFVHDLIIENSAGGDGIIWFVIVQHKGYHLDGREEEEACIDQSEELLFRRSAASQIIVRDMTSRIHSPSPARREVLGMTSWHHRRVLVAFLQRICFFLSKASFLHLHLPPHRSFPYPITYRSSPAGAKTTLCPAHRHRSRLTTGFAWRTQISYFVPAQR